MNTLSELLGITRKEAPKEPLKGTPGPLFGTLRARLETEILPVWLPARRWYRSKTRTLAATVFETLIPFRSGEAVFGILRVEFADAEPERYFLPLALATPAEAA